jgi:hypothetical protein
MASSFRVICADFNDTDDAESLFTLTKIIIIIIIIITFI